MGSADEKRLYIVTASLIGWAHTQNDPYWYHQSLALLTPFFVIIAVNWQNVSNMASDWRTAQPLANQKSC